MNNTETSFRDKWERNENLAFAETLRENSDIQNWILNRNGWKSSHDLKAFLLKMSNVLDAGCGNGRVTALLSRFAREDASVVGLDLAAWRVAQENLKAYTNVVIHAGNLMENNSALGKFDFIYCQEVLHHTDNPEKCFQNLVLNNLSKGGCIAIYVYRKKAPIREFSDDLVREQISQLPYDEAMKFCDQITSLGKTLSDLNLKIQVPAVDALKIEAGEYDIQRFFYHYFMKCFWNNVFSFHDNSVINYDWFHPENCARYEPAEIRTWFAGAGLKVSHEFVDPYGITMHGIAPTTSEVL